MNADMDDTPSYAERYDNDEGSKGGAISPDEVTEHAEAMGMTEAEWMAQDMSPTDLED